jgi:hypothetical protein
MASSSSSSVTCSEPDIKTLDLTLKDCEHQRKNGNELTSRYCDPVRHGRMNGDPLGPGQSLLKLFILKLRQLVFKLILNGRDVSDQYMRKTL